MRRERFGHPPAELGAFYIHDDAVWLCEPQGIARRVAWIRREADAFQVMTQPGEHGPIRHAGTHLLITAARTSLKRQMSRLRAKASR